MTAESIADFSGDTPFGLLIERFGEQSDLKGAAHRFARWSNGAAAVHAINVATGIDDLPDTEPAGG